MAVTCRQRQDEHDQRREHERFEQLAVADRESHDQGAERTQDDGRSRGQAQQEAADAFLGRSPEQQDAHGRAQDAVDGQE